MASAVAKRQGGLKRLGSRYLEQSCWPGRALRPGMHPQGWPEVSTTKTTLPVLI